MAVAGETVTLDLILQVYRRESQRKALTSLPRDFWSRVRGYVGELEADLRKESATDPNSAKAALLRDELKKVVKRRDQIYQYRERKMTRLAASAASGAAVDTAALTPEETASFEGVLQVLQRGRRRALGGEEEAEETLEAAPKTASNPAPAGEPKKVPSKGGGRRKESKRGKKNEEARGEAKLLVRILEDVPPFVGVDVTYELRKEDVVGLPKDVAEVLVGRGVAEPIRPKV